MTAPALLTVSQAAKRLAVGERTLREWISTGGIQIVRVGSRSVRISEATLAKYIADHTETRGKTAVDYRRPGAWN